MSLPFEILVLYHFGHVTSCNFFFSNSFISVQDNTVKKKEYKIRPTEVDDEIKDFGKSNS